jgi:hypothetical protein
MKYPSDWKEELSKKPICGVLATAVAASVTFEKATDAIKRSLMPWQKRHGGKTYPEQVAEAMNKLGVNYTQLPQPERMTLHKWHSLYAMPNVHYMVWTSGHVVTVQNAYAMDQYEIAHIDEFGPRRCYVREVFIINSNEC